MRTVGYIPEEGAEQEVTEQVGTPNRRSRKTTEPEPRCRPTPPEPKDDGTGTPVPPEPPEPKADGTGTPVPPEPPADIGKKGGKKE